MYGQCENVMVMKGHTGAIMELCFSPDGAHMYTGATDNTVAVWDVPTGQRVKKLKGHANFVNSVSGMRVVYQSSLMEHIWGIFYNVSYFDVIAAAMTDLSLQVQTQIFLLVSRNMFENTSYMTEVNLRIISLYHSPVLACKCF